MSRARRSALMIVGLLAVGACTSEPRATAATTPTSEAGPLLPVSLVDGTGTAVTITSVDRIVPVDGDLAEIVFALGLGDRVVATDISATYPAAADELPEIGYQRALNPEPIAAMEPTVVLATDLARPAETLEQLRGLGIAVVVIERTMSIDGFAAKVQAVADALGVPQRGAALVSTMQAQVADARAAALQAGGSPRVLALYLRGEQVQLIFGQGTGIDAVLPAVGAVDVSTELGIVDTQQMTAEAMLLAAPDVLLVTTSGLESVGGIDGLLAIPGIARTPAGRERRVLAYEDQYLLGGGPRIGDLMLELVRDLHPSTPNTEGTP
ncbi:MAG: ABC transporter substrate-binding protein [Actinomycetota bacterium]|nr:ABC transporter substrate-binding protein [Actinomycetota bacterium]